MNDIIDCMCSIHGAMANIQGVCHISHELLTSIENGRHPDKRISGSGWFEAEKENALDDLDHVVGLSEDGIVLECHYEGRSFRTGIMLERIGMTSAVFTIL